MTKKVYMVVVGFEDCPRENLEVIDYNLSLEEAKRIKHNYDIAEEEQAELDANDDECAIIDCSAKIVEHVIF